MGLHLRTIIVKPMESLFNLYEFMKMLSYFAEFHDRNPLERVHTLDFTFSCHQLVEREGNQELVFGTGGKLLQSLIRLMRNLSGKSHVYKCNIEWYLEISSNKITYYKRDDKNQILDIVSTYVREL